MNMISPITMNELENELWIWYNQSQWMNKNIAFVYDITNHNGWIRIWAMPSSITKDELEYELAITNHNGWIRILPMHMISPITMDETEFELCYHQL